MTIMHSALKYFLISILGLTLISCGFQPRGDLTLPPQLRVIYVKSSNPYGKFEHNLKRSLREVGIGVVDNPNKEAATLQILQTTLVSTPSSVGTGPQATIYTVVYTVQIALFDPEGHQLIAPQNVSSRTTMIVNAQQTISATNQLDITSQELQRDVIVQIFDILTSTEAQGIKKKKSITEYENNL